VAALGLAVGTLCAPTLRKHYHLRRLRDDDPQVRLDAMNTLAAIAVDDASVADPLVHALIHESDNADAPASQHIDIIAAWAIERSEAVHTGIGQALASAEDDRYLQLARWLRAAGKWGPDARTTRELVKRERLRLESPHATTRLQALEALEAIGPDAAPFLEDALPPLLQDPDEAVRVALITTAAVCLEPEKAADAVLLPAVDDASQHVQQQALITLGLVRPGALCRLLHERRFDAHTVLRASEAFLFAPVPGALEPAFDLLASDDPNVRALAAWTHGYEVGLGEEAGRATHAALVEMLVDDDQVVAARSAMALGRRRGTMEDVSPLIELSQHHSPDARLAALFALGQCARTPDARHTAVPHLRNVLLEALRSGESQIATAAVESLGYLDDRPYLDVMLDVVDEFEDQPMLQYAAATAAARIDEAAGSEAFLNLCSSLHDEVRELAALQIALLPDAPVERLIEALTEGGDPQRGAAALALGLCGVRQLAPGQPLDQWLAERLDTRSPDFEPSWQLRTYYLCARLLCGSESVRDDLDVYLLNRNVSRMGLFITLLHLGEKLPLDSLLLGDGAVDAESFLFDARFYEVIQRYAPEACGLHGFAWQDDAEVRTMHSDLLRRWWRVHRARCAFNEHVHRFFMPVPREALEALDRFR